MSEKEQIKQLIETRPKQAAKMVKNSPALWEWVQANSPSNLSVIERIYISISGTNNTCEFGNAKKLKSVIKGWGFCGGAATCQCAKNSVSANCVKASKDKDWKKIVELRRKTNLEKYGCKNAAQSSHVKEQHQKFYLDAESVKIAVAKQKDTVQKKYGVDNVAQLDATKEKRKTTLVKKYGVDNPLKSEAIKKRVQDTKKQRYDDRYLLDRSYGPMVTKFKQLGYTFLVEKENYLGVDQKNTVKYKFLHDKCQTEFETYIYSGNRPVCPACFYKNPSFVSKAERELGDWIEEQNVKVIRTERRLIAPYHVDVYLPDYKLGIEYCGLFWHSQNSRGKTPTYHQNKMLLCQKNDVQLITIFEDEWLNKKDLVKSIILNRLGKSKKYYARKCAIKEVSGSDTREFLGENHLQGYTSSAVNIGLFFDNELISVMTFAKPRYDKKYQWEIIRYCTKIGCSVVGGKNKIWNYFCGKFLPKSIISYCDLRWFTGDGYKNLGMTLSKQTGPTYWYNNYSKRWHRSNFTKQRLVSMGHDKTLTEQQITESIGLDRIWDCGNAVYTISFEQ